MKVSQFFKEQPWGWILAYWGLSYLGHLVGLAFRQSSVTTLFFFPAGLTLAFLLIVGPKYAPLAALPHMLRGLIAPFPHAFLPGVVLGLFHAQAYGLMAYLLKSRLRIDIRLKSLRDIGWMLSLAAIIPLLSGWWAMTFLLSEGILTPESLRLNIFRFWLGDLSAILAFTPFLLQWVVPAVQGAPRRKGPVPKPPRAPLGAPGRSPQERRDEHSGSTRFEPDAAGCRPPPQPEGTTPGGRSAASAPLNDEPHRPAGPSLRSIPPDDVAAHGGFGTGPLPKSQNRFDTLEILAQTSLLVLLPHLWSLVGAERGWAFLHLAFLPFLWIGLRQGLPGVTLALPLGTLMIAIYAPMAPQGSQTYPNDVSYFLVALAATSLFMGAAFSERLRAQRSERQQAMRLRQLLDGSPVTIAVHQAGRFTYVNEAGAQLLGFKGPEELLGQDIRIVIHPESLELAGKRIRQAETTSGPIGSAEERLQRRDGSTVDVEMHTTGFMEGGKPTIQVVAVDITRRKEAERQLHGLLKEKELLLREVQHRVKNNLQVMASLLNLQAGYARQVETKKALQEAQERLRTLSLIHQRLEPTPQPVPVNLSEFLEQLAQRLTRSYALVPGQVDLDLRMASLTLSVETATRMGMLLNELLSNCFKHAFPLGRRGRVEVRLWQEPEGEVHLVVADDGPGLAEGFKIEDATTLGFQILLSLTEQLKGSLSLERRPGCALHLRFPPPEPL